MAAIRFHDCQTVVIGFHDLNYVLHVLLASPMA